MQLESTQSEGSAAFSRWARRLATDLQHASEAVRWSTDPADHAFVSRVRRWACSLGVEGCLAQPVVRHATAAEPRYKRTSLPLVATSLLPRLSTALFRVLTTQVH